jgi:sec-independent protein translocase protein TatA
MLLFLNDVAGSEILLILAFILIFFGSKSIPGIARTLGRTMRQIKDASSELQGEIKKSGLDIKKDLNFNRIIEDTAEDIKRPLDQYVSDLNHAVSYNSPTRPKKQEIETIETRESIETIQPEMEHKATHTPTEKTTEDKIDTLK